MKFLQVIWKDIRSGQNIDIYITAAIAVVVAILGVFGVANLTVITSAILAILALISVNLLLNRYQNEDIRKLLSKSQTPTGTAKQFFKQRYMLPEVKQSIGNSRKAFLWGNTFASAITILDHEIQQALKNGLEIRFLLIKPGSSSVSSAPQMMAFRSDRFREAAEVSDEIERNFKFFSRYQQQSSGGNVEVRVVDYLPPWTVFIVDPHQLTGEMFVHLSVFRLSDEERPSFKLTAQDDSEWFNFFVEQFESVWNEAEQISLDKYRKQ